MDVALAVQEALVGVVHVVHGPEVALVVDAALVRTGEVVGRVEVVHVDDVGQLRAARVVAALAPVDRGVLGACKVIQTPVGLLVLVLRTACEASKGHLEEGLRSLHSQLAPSRA